MFCTCLLPYFSGGPDWWRKSTEYYSSCRSYWWTNILYINNFYRSHDDQVCHQAHRYKDRGQKQMDEWMNEKRI